MKPELDGGTDHASPQGEAQFGIRMGYPKTAVAEYVRYLDPTNTISQAPEPEIPEEVAFSEYMDFSAFRPFA